MSAKPRVKLHAFVARGPDKGKQLIPHLHEDGCFVVSSTKFEKDYIRIPANGELMPSLEAGLKLRMSNHKDPSLKAPRLIKPEHIYRPVKI